MLITGRTLWHIPSSNNQAPPGGDLAHVPADLADNSMAAVFNRAGYDTFRTCKEGNSYPPGDSLFTVLHEQSMRGGTPETSSEWHGDRAVEFLQQREATGDADPFLMFFGFSHPHDTRDGTPDLLATVRSLQRDRTADGSEPARAAVAAELSAGPSVSSRASDAAG